MNEQVKEVLIQMREIMLHSLEEARGMRSRIGQNPTANAYVNAKIEVCERLVIFISNSIKEETIDMKKLELELGESGSLDDIMKAPRGGIIGPAIKELADKMEPGEYKAINPEALSWNTFSGRVWAMRRIGQIDKSIVPMKRGDKYYLVRYTPDLVKDLEERSKSRKNRK